MKTLTCCSLLSFSLLAFASPIIAQNHLVTESRSITVSGTAEKSLPANCVRISVRVRSVSPQLSEAQGASQSVFSKVVKQLGELGIPAKTIELRNHELGKEYQTGPDRRKVFKGYFSARDFVVELNDTSLLQAAHEELAQNADVEVNNTAFSRSDEIEIRKELRKKALIAAKEKATEMAEVYGQRPSRPLTIREGGAFSPTSFNTRNTFAAEPAAVVGGRVSLSASVEVKFELMSK